MRPDRPFRDIEYDERVRALDGYAETERGFAASRRVRKLYGTEARRLALAWAYASVEAPDWRSAWGQYWRSVIEPEWRYITIANLTNYRSEIGDVQLMDGVSIRQRRRTELLAIMEWTPDQFDQSIGSDWMTNGSSEYVLLVETAAAKDPHNVVMVNTGQEAVLAARTLMALRLSGGGDVGLGSQFTTRVGGPPILLLGFSSSPSLLRFASGPDFVMSQSRMRAAKAIIEQLAELEAEPADSFVELRSALDRFRAAFDRPWQAHTDRIIDDMIALESIAADSTEMAYTISVRVSGMLADSDSDRVALFRLLKQFYRVRSIIVHGGTLRGDSEALVRREPELREIVRGTLRGLLNLRASSSFRPTTSFLKTTIDDLVLDSGRRGGLRVAMGTTGWTPGAPDDGAPVQRITRLWVDET